MCRRNLDDYIKQSQDDFQKLSGAQVKKTMAFRDLTDALMRSQQNL